MQRQSKTEVIVHGLKDKIDSGILRPNTLVTEAQLAEEYGVSITPAREALNWLCADGYFEKLPHKGYMVKGITYEEIQQLFEFRMYLEDAITRIAVQRATMGELEAINQESLRILSLSDEEIFSNYNTHNFSFHIALANTTKNPYLINTFLGVLRQLSRAMSVGTRISDSRSAIERHISRCHAIMQRDEALALQLLQGDLSNTLHRVGRPGV